MDDGGFLLLLLISCVICGFVGAGLLRRSGRDTIGFVLGFFLGPIGILVAAIMRLEKSEPAARPQGTKFCSNCGGLISATARHCEHCGHAVVVPGQHG